jgi:Tfp pilus assembly protein PilO
VTARLNSLPKGAQVALVAGGLVFVALVGYFAVIAPKHHTAAALKSQTANVQAEIDHNRSTAFTQALPAVRSASVFSLTKAMPNQLETPDVILQLNELAKSSGISFDQIQPGAADSLSTAATDTTDPFAVEPIQVKFSGSFYDLLTFLQRLHNLVRVQHGSLYTAGRLFDVSQVTFAEGPNTWPQVTATLVINEFVPQAPQSTTTATPGSTDTTSTTTTGTTTTTSTPTSAAPSTSGGS